jgi:hypothetical protein
MTSRALILATVLLFVNGCDYSQKKPETGAAPSAGVSALVTANTWDVRSSAQ